MSGNKGFRRNHRRGPPKHVVGETSREVLELINENNPTIQLFQIYAQELDDKHDRMERIIKTSRDITIESKRIIFLLHNTATDIEGKKEKIFTEAEQRLDKLKSQFETVASELKGQDHYLYLKAYTNGVQEFLEALLFYKYQHSKMIPNYDQILQNFNTNPHLECPVFEIILSLADFTGEMMRKCINNLGSGNIEDCFKICNFVKSIYVGFLGLNLAGHSLAGRKLYVLKQSLIKMEVVCYNIRVRGSEVPKHMLATVVTATEENVDDDEGFY